MNITGRPLRREMLYRLRAKLLRQSKQYKEAMFAEQDDLFARNRYEGMWNALRICAQEIEDLLKD